MGHQRTKRNETKWKLSHHLWMSFQSWNTGVRLDSYLVSSRKPFTWSPWACLPMMIGLVQPGTRRGMFLQMMASRNTVPPRMLRMVPLGERHICFSLNSSTRFSSGVMVAHLMPTLYRCTASAASTVTWSSVASRFSIPRSKLSPTMEGKSPNISLITRRQYKISLSVFVWLWAVSSFSVAQTQFSLDINTVNLNEGWKF